MNILALDTATRTGYAVHSSGVVSSNVIDCSIRTAPTKTLPADHAGKRFSEFRTKLRELIRLHRPHLIVYESIVGGRSAGGNTSLIQKGLEASVLENAYNNPFGLPIPIWTFAPATIKKWAIGSGLLTHESKIAVVEFAALTFGTEDLIPHKPTKSHPWKWDDNQCDALWILDLARAVESRLTLAGRDPLAIESDSLTDLARLVTAEKWNSTSKSRRP